MSDTPHWLVTALESHPRLAGLLITTLLFLSYGVSAVAAGGGSGGTVG